MRALDLEVFADIKLHDIPTTVGRAARVLGRQGVRYLNFHAAGRSRHVARRSRRTRREARSGHRVTDTDRGHGADERSRREARSRNGSRARSKPGCGAWSVRSKRSSACTPGARLRHHRSRRALRRRRRHDQARVGTPEGVARAGGDVLVVGRAVTRADDPRCGAARLRRSRERSHGRLARGRARKPSASCDAAQCRYAAPLLIRGGPNLSESTLSHHAVAPEEQHGEPAHAHTGAASTRAREGRRRAPPARGGEGQAEDRLAHVARAVRARPSAATSRATCSPS